MRVFFHRISIDIHSTVVQWLEHLNLTRRFYIGKMALAFFLC